MLISPREVQAVSCRDICTAESAQCCTQQPGNGGDPSAWKTRSDERARRRWRIHTRELTAIKGEILTFTTTCMELEVTTFSEVGQTHEDRHHMISLTRGV